MPPTTGGRTIDRVIKARMNRRPGKFTRAKSHASGTPKMTQRIAVINDVFNDNHKASRISCFTTMSVNLLQGVRHNKPINGESMKATANNAIAKIGQGSFWR
jgi:hypothetical protein